MLLSTLKQIGLDEKQAKIYLACLELGETTIKEIAKKAEIKRTTIYDFIDEMINSGYLKQTIKGKRTKYIAISPDELKVVIQKKEALLNQILPQLNMLSNLDRVKPRIWFFNGVDGLKEAYSDTLRYSGEILAIGGEDTIKTLGQKWIIDYIEKRKKKNIACRGIVAKSEFIEKEFTSKDQEQFRTSKLIDSKKYPFPIEINIYGYQKVFFISARDQVAVTIESAEIFQAMKSFFNLVWDSLPEIERI